MTESTYRITLNKQIQWDIEEVLRLEENLRGEPMDADLTYMTHWLIEEYYGRIGYYLVEMIREAPF